MKNKYYLKIFLIVATVLLVYGCRHWDNFTTYFNTYYNANRLLKESEEEFAYQDEKKRITPRVFIPEPRIVTPDVPTSAPPPFLEGFIVSQQKLQPVKIKLDSVIIKGSKILAKHPRSDFIEGTLYLMAKAYFYRNEWLPSQIKCSELIDRFPEGDLSPDAHLLYSENLLIQRKFSAGKTMLSRTVDIAWYKKRYDILSEAFSLQAELALYERDIEGALKPYKQAIAQAEDDEIKAKWQVDLAALLYRLHRFPEAEKNFAKAHSFSPDYVTEFEAYLYQALSLIRMGEYDKGLKIVSDLESDGNNQEWLAWAFAARMTVARMKKEEKEFETAEKFADSAYMNNHALLAVYFEKGMDYYFADNYLNARKYFARTRNVRSVVYATSERMYALLNSLDQKQQSAKPFLTQYSQGTITDTSRIMLAQYTFEAGRIFEQLGRQDSALSYYKAAIEYSPPQHNASAKYLYVYARSIQASNLMLYDSLMEVVAEKYPLTEHGKEALQKLGYTAKFVIDTVAELYVSGSKLRENKEFPFAIIQFLKIYNDYPKSKLAPKALYSVGWIFEKDLKLVDSALHYYRLLMEKYPYSEYAKDVNLSVVYLLALQSGEPLPDSLKPRETKLIPKPPVLMLQQQNLNTDKSVETPAQKKDSTKKGGINLDFNPTDLLNDPGKLLKNAKETFTNPENLVPDIKTNIPLNLLQQNPDSTNKKIENPVEENELKEPGEEEEKPKK